MSALTRAPVLLLLLAAACGDPVIDSLADAEPLLVKVRVGRTPDSAPGRAAVTATLHSEVNGQCLVLESFTASLAGRQATRASDGDYEQDFGCYEPRAEFTVDLDPPIPAAQLVLADPSRTITVELGNVLVPRAGELVVPADRLVVPGERLELNWSEPSDLVTGALTISVRSFRGGGFTVLDARAEGGRIVADMPGDAATLAEFPIGNGELCATWWAKWNDNQVTLPCNAGTCELDATHGICIPVGFTRRP